LELNAGNQVKINQKFDIPKVNGVLASVTVSNLPCADVKHSGGFSQISEANYLFDNAGNLISDPNKKVTFHYNYLNLPYRIVGSENDELVMLYGADGKLLQRRYLKNNNQVYKRDYISNKEYTNNTLESIYHNDVRIIKNGGIFDYEFNIKDHLGNVRVVFSDLNNNGFISSNEVMQRNDYYAFGMLHKNATSNLSSSLPKNRFKFNGKEEVSDMRLNLLDYHARSMAVELGRWVSVDQAAHEYANLSPYTYVLNNPIRAIDPDGRRVFFVAGANNDRDGWNYMSRWGQSFANSGISGFTRLNVSSGKWGDVAFTNSYRHSGTEMYQSGMNMSNHVAGLAPAPEWKTRPVQNEVIDNAVNQIKTNLSENPLAEGEQLNLGGYSYGSVVQAQAALKLANEGTFVDNLILIGSPISSDSDLYKQLSGNKNIGNIIRYDISGDKLSNPKDILDFINGAYQNKSDSGPHFDLARPGSDADKAIKVVTDWLKSQGVK
jgi:RHS repeat-associated protein